MKPVDLPFLYRKTIKGKTYIYFRRVGKLTRLPDNPDSLELMGAYWDCRTGKAARQSRRTWKTLIIGYYNSPSFKKIFNGTQQNYRRHCEANRGKNADKNMTGFRRRVYARCPRED